VRGFLALLDLLTPPGWAVVGLVVWLATYDARRRSETVLLADFGIPEWRLALVAALPPAVLEVLIGLLT
jgi:hypothetical protein